MVLNYALISRINRIPDRSFFHSCPRWVFLLFYSKLNKLSRCVHKSNVENYYNYRSNNRLQSATKKKGCIDRTRHRCMLFLAWVLDGSLKNKLKPNKLINWLISQQMLLWIIILRLMNMCCATKQFSATKISNRKIKVYLLSDGFVY